MTVRWHLVLWRRRLAGWLRGHLATIIVATGIWAVVYVVAPLPDRVASNAEAIHTACVGLDAVASALEGVIADSSGPVEVPAGITDPQLLAAYAAAAEQGAAMRLKFAGRLDRANRALVRLGCRSRTSTTTTTPGGNP